MTTRVSPSMDLSCSASATRFSALWRTSKGSFTTSPKGRGTATVLFLLETSIPARSYLSLLKRICNGLKPSLPIADSICLVTRTHSSTCTNRTLRIGGWLTDLSTGAKPLEEQVRPLPSYSNRLGNETPRLVAAATLPRQI